MKKVKSKYLSIDFRPKVKDIKKIYIKDGKVNFSSTKGFKSG